MNATGSRGRQITVSVLKHDGHQYRRWHGQLVEWKDSLLVLKAEFDVDVSHQLLGEIKRGTKTIEYYWIDRWYNVFRFLAADETTRLWYCNIATPPKVSDNTLTYVDLDIDIVVQPDYSYQVLDLDEFETNVHRYSYSDEHKTKARAAVNQLTSMIEGRQFPFVDESSSVSSLV
jgi:protein associated with RNAse G/E